MVDKDLKVPFIRTKPSLCVWREHDLQYGNNDKTLIAPPVARLNMLHNAVYNVKWHTLKAHVKKVKLYYTTNPSRRLHCIYLYGTKRYVQYSTLWNALDALQTMVLQAHTYFRAFRKDYEREEGENASPAALLLVQLSSTLQKAHTSLTLYFIADPHLVASIAMLRIAAVEKDRTRRADLVYAVGLLFCRFFDDWFP